MNGNGPTNKRNNGGRNRQEGVSPIRCAVYTRVSTENGLDSDFNSLDAQREACEAYIQSQRGEGWFALSTCYEDGGYSGSNFDRPALQRLFIDIESDKIDCVVVYKLDRLSRSLIDFTKLIDLLEKRHVSFVSVTQQFNSANSMGRLTLNILLSFAQFEREIIAERTRDKMCAARRKGKWTGGIPMLGYDIDPKGGKLIVNRLEAERVREIFTLYLQHRSLLKVVQELNARSWTTKSWVRKDGNRRQGKSFTKTNLHNLLINSIYLGKVKLQGDIYDGEHEAIIEEPLWNQVKKVLKNNKYGYSQSNRHGALLQSLVRCAHCKTAMFHSFTQKGNRRYRYYVCSSAQKQGYKTCPSRSVPAAEMEKFVVERIREIGHNSTLLESIFKKSRAESKATKTPCICRKDLENAFSLFDTIWEMLFPKEQARIMQLLVERIDYDAGREIMSITFSSEGIRILSAEMESVRKEKNETTSQ